MASILKSFAKKGKTLKLRGYGQSMSPLLIEGDLLTLEKISFDEIKVQDIVLVSNHDQEFVHRVIYKTPQYLITKGDNHEVPDRRVSRTASFAKVVAVKRGKQTLKLEDIYLAHSQVYFQVIAELAAAFQKAKLEWVLLKGTPLYLYLTKNVPQRLLDDCDILVNDQGPKCTQVLSTLGFRQIPTEYSPLHRRLKNKETECLFVKPGLVNVYLDVHYEAGFLMNQVGSLNPLYLDKNLSKLTQTFFREKFFRKIQRLVLPCLSPANQALYLALHLFHHNYQGARRYELLIITLNQLKNAEQRELITKINQYQLNNWIYPVFWYLDKLYKDRLNLNFLKRIKVTDKALTYYKRYIFPKSIFDVETRMVEGMNRFRNIFWLSPEPFWRKVTIFANLAVVYNSCWTIISSANKRLIKALKS